MMIIKLLILVLSVLLSMGFFLLIERKLMGLVHFRFGPNKVFFVGVLQFIFDMLKLVGKEHSSLYLKNLVSLNFLYLIICLSFFFWFLISFNYLVYLSEYYFLVLVVLMMVKLLFLSFFLLSHKSFYVQVSFVRVVVQFISYDMLIIYIIFFFFVVVGSMGVLIFFFYQRYLFFCFVSFSLVLAWLVSVLMEVLRLPFDFYEGESELISGFNLELGSLTFVVLFMIEYVDMIYFVNLSSVIFFGWNSFMNLLMLFVFLWIRTLLIRFRFDLMLNLMWKTLFFFLVNFSFVLFYLVFY